MAGALAVAGAPLRADEVDVRGLLERLERLERQNEELRRTLEQHQEVLRQLGPPAGAEPAPAEPATPAPKSAAKDAAIRDIVRDYLKEVNDRQKAEEEAKRKAAQEAGYEIGSDLSMRANWRDGVQLESANRDFRVHFGGRFQADSAWFNPDAGLSRAFPTTGNWLDGADFRRIRCRADGTVWEIFDFFWEMEFSQGINGQATHPFPTDIFIDFKMLPLLGNIAVGHYKEPFSMTDYGTPDSFGVFMERAVDDAFSPDRNLGIMWHNAYFNDTVAIASGIFKPNSDARSGNVFDYGDGEYAYSSRIAFMPIYANDGRCWLLFALAWSHRILDPDDAGLPPNATNPSRARFQIRPPIRVNSPVLADTGPMQADNFDLYNLQLSVNLGSVLLQGEYYNAQVHNVRRGAFAPGVPRLLNPTFQGWYAQASWFITGEYHPINRKLGRLLRVQPNELWFFTWQGDRGDRRGFARGWGAWEIAVRYSYVDLTSPALGDFPGVPGLRNSGVRAVTTAGIEQDITISISCFLNPQMRLQANYARALRRVADPTKSGEVDILGMRFWFDF